MTHPAASEHSEQAALVARCAVYATRWPALRLLIAIPNGGHRHKAVAAKMKAEGVKSGVLDLTIPVRSHDGRFIGLWLEMKVGRNKPTPAQIEWITALRAEGHCVEICYGADAAWAVICDYLGIEQ